VPNSIRTYDSDGYRQRAAAVCVKDEKGEEVLLVTSKRAGLSKWVIPGGGVEPGECAADAAEREVFEEAGVKGAIVRKLGIFENEECKHRTSVYLFRVTEEFHDWEDARRIGRKRRWFPTIEARCLLGMNKQSQQAYLDTMSASAACSSSTSTTSVVEHTCVVTANGKIPNEENMVNPQQRVCNSPSDGSELR